MQLFKQNTKVDVSSPGDARTPNGGKTYRQGTLIYTSGSLALLFLWLLWGDFALFFFETVFARYVPLYFKDLHASNTLIGVLTGSIPGIVNILFLPNISQWSDGYHSSLGRRIPFLYIVTPLTAFSLIAVGFAPEMSHWVLSHLLSRLGSTLSLTALTLFILCVFVFLYHLFNMILVSAYSWLLRDVVPLEWMPRFLALFRIVGSLGNVAFLWLIFPHAVSHRKTTFLIVGLYYLFSFLLMCLNVKEGEYSPPPVSSRKPSLLRSYLSYFKHCLSISIYRNFFITYVLGVLATACASPFASLFARDNLGLTMDDIGLAFAWGAAVSILAYYPVGLLCERISPIIVIAASLMGMALASLWAFLCVHTKIEFLAYSIVISVPLVFWVLGLFTTSTRIFPEQYFGKFYSGLNVFGCGFMIIGNLCIGQLLDLLHDDYRVIFLWCAVFFFAAIYPIFRVYHFWKINGGPDAYLAPIPDE